ncbi:MAG: cytochrome c biogenesis protein CcsA [Planctomycetes bacterium]|nr:cytochrome c biogenesis protein CcsA [Planctomycetota bacterium]
MRRLTCSVVVLLCTASLVSAGAPRDEDFDDWRSLPVQSGGRRKPLDTLARESLRLIRNRADFPDPKTGERLGPTALWLKMLFDWQGWQHPQRSNLLLLTNWTGEYFHLHKADQWDQARLFRVDFLPLRSALGLNTDGGIASAVQLANAQVTDSRTDTVIPFVAWARKLSELEESGEALNEIEKRGLELANRYWTYQHLRMGRMIEVLPLRGSETQDWMPIATLLLAELDETSDPGGKLRRAQQLLRGTHAAYRSGDAAAFRKTSGDFLAALRLNGPELGPYPTAAKMSLEVAYNTWAPFRMAWGLMLTAFVTLLLHLGSGWRTLHWGAMTAYVAALAATIAGFALRITIAGRPPVTNMYESVIYVGFGVALLGLVLELVTRQKHVLAAASAVATVALILADNCPTILDPSVQPLQPVLRSNFWLVTHVMTITLSYAAFALAMGIANVTLGYLLFRSAHHAAIAGLSRFTYKSLQVGVLLLAAGVILGGIWADYSWGRFWGWDPKEVWALVALLGYLAVLHARYAGWVGHRGLAALSAVCFAMVIMAWYGVNFVLGAGLHSYGFGAGGAGYVAGGLALQMLYVLAAINSGASRQVDREGADRRESVAMSNAGA